MSTDTRTYWNTEELQAMHNWINTAGNVQWSDGYQIQVNNAMKSVLPASRWRKIETYSQAKRAMERINESTARLPNPTTRQAVQVPFISPTAPLASNPQQSMTTVLVNRGSSIVVNMTPGKYILEVL